MFVRRATWKALVSQNFRYLPFLWKYAASCSLLIQDVYLGFFFFFPPATGSCLVLVLFRGCLRIQTVCPFFSFSCKDCNCFRKLNGVVIWMVQEESAALSICCFLVCVWYSVRGPAKLPQQDFFWKKKRVCVCWVINVI